MSRFCMFVVMMGGTLLAAVLADTSQPRTSRNQPAANMPVVVSADVAEPAKVISPANPTVSHSLIAGFRAINAARERNQIEKSQTQRLIDAINAALSSGDAALISQASQNEFQELIKNDPQAAADLARELSAGYLREQWLRAVAHGWATQDSMTALAWADGLTDTEDRSTALADVCVQMSQSDPGLAISAAIQHGLSNQNGLLENMMQQWATQDPTAAFDWADQLPAGSDRDEMMSRLAFAEAQVSPVDAARLVASEIPPGSSQEEAAMSVLHQWALQDFAGAMAWADQFQDDSLRDRAQQEVAGIETYRRALDN